MIDVTENAIRKIEHMLQARLGPPGEDISLLRLPVGGPLGAGSMFHATGPLLDHEALQLMSRSEPSGRSN